MYLHRTADDDDEVLLIARCLAGQPEAFEPLVERYHRPLFRMAVRLLGDREEARDATQTAFLKGYQALATCDRGRRFFTWIYRILINECLNTIRARRQTEPITDVAASSGGDAVEGAETGAPSAAHSCSCPPSTVTSSSSGISQNCPTRKSRRLWEFR